MRGRAAEMFVRSKLFFFFTAGLFVLFRAVGSSPVQAYINDKAQVIVFQDTVMFGVTSDFNLLSKGKGNRR